MHEIVPELIGVQRCVLGEGPIWDHINETLIWTDINRKEVHQYHTDDDSFSTTICEKKIGALCIKSGGGYMAAVEDGFAEIVMDTGMIKMCAEIKEHHNRFNDGKCDVLGRFWAGTTSMIDLPGSANLYSLSNGFKVQKRLQNVSISNGMAWSLDNLIFYYIDTHIRAVVSYNFDVVSGDISNRKKVFRILEGYPDGMTIDEEGMLWIALWDGWKVIRVNPLSGVQIGEILLPVARVTSCVFGGSALTDLYVTTAKLGLSDQELGEQPLAGALFRIRGLPCKGIKAFEYRE